MERRLTTILAADVVGYSRLMEGDEEATVRTLSTYREIINNFVIDHHGRVFGGAGDSVIAEFASPVEAVRCAVAIQRELETRDVDLPEERRMRLRIGVNLSDVIVDDDNLLGDGVNIAARLETLAEPGGVSIARSVFDQVKKQLDLGYEYLGEHEVKNIAEPLQVYRVLLQSEAAAKIIGDTKRTTQSWKRMVLSAVVVVLISVAGLVTWTRPWESKIKQASEDLQSFTLSDKPSIVVLPFTNMSDDPNQGYFADGLTDDLITDLSKISGMFVIARHTAFTYKNRAVDVQQVARKLKVRYVLEGSVRRVGNKIRINAQLIDGKNGGHIWADRFDRDASDIFAVQDEVIKHIVNTLAIQLTTPEQQRLERLPTKNLEAYDYYQRAEQAARTGFRPQLREALRLYEKAMALDSSFAQAFAADARTAAYVMRSNYDTVLPAPVARKRSYENAGKALEINPEESLPYTVLAILQVVDGRHKDALASVKRAIALGPSEAEAHAALSFVLTFSGRHADAISAIDTMIQLNPNLPTGDSIVAGLAFLLNDQPERAIQILERARTDAPNVDDIYVMLTAAYTLIGRLDAARTAAADVVRLSPNVSVARYRLTLGYLRNEQDLTKIINALSAGGLPEWPYGFSASSRDKLTAEQIKQLAFGQTWQGHLGDGGPALAQFKPNGDLVFRTANQLATGRAFISGDMLCEQIEATSFGKPVCGPIYSRADSTGNEALDYTYVNATKTFHFSAVE